MQWCCGIAFLSHLTGCTAAAPGEMRVLGQRTYQSLSNPDDELSKDELIKGMKYGRTLVTSFASCQLRFSYSVVAFLLVHYVIVLLQVPFTAVDESVMKYTASSCLKVIYPLFWGLHYNIFCISLAFVPHQRVFEFKPYNAQPAPTITAENEN